MRRRVFCGASCRTEYRTSRRETIDNNLGVRVDGKLVPVKQWCMSTARCPNCLDVMYTLTPARGLEREARHAA